MTFTATSSRALSVVEPWRSNAVTGRMIGAARSVYSPA
jgi:hypothetical protein